MCSICTEGLDAGGSTHTIDCGHTFHSACICNWFRTGNPSCPMCRDTTCDEEALNWNDSLARASELRRYARRKNAPTRLKQLVQEVRNAEAKEKEVRHTMAEFKRRNKDVIAAWSKFRPTMWHARAAIRRKLRTVGTFASPECPMPNLRRRIDLRLDLD